MKIKVTASYSGKLPTASYSNVNPFFACEEEWEEDLTPEQALNRISVRQKALHAVCLENFKLVADQAKVEKLKTDMKHFRFYSTEYGDLPSVTTILSQDFVQMVSDEDLAIATSEGNIQHARAHKFIETGQWLDPKELDGIANDLMRTKGRDLDTWDFPAFLKKFPFRQLNNGVTVYNKDYRYAGTFDAVGLYPINGEPGQKEVLTMIDFKRSADKMKNFTQIAAYAKCCGLDIEQMAIIETNTDTVQKFSKPILSTSIDKFFELFLHKRKEFFSLYGV